MIILKAEKLTKIYQNRIALNSINIELESGKVYGLLGPNGSGKTTFMKIIANLMQPTTGSLLINGDVPSAKSRAVVAYMPTHNYIYKNMKLDEVGTFYTDFFEDFDNEKYLKLLDVMELLPALKVSALSSGMAAKLRVAIAMSRNAKIIMLDEPLNGIDLLTRDSIIKAIVEYASKEATIIVSSHMVELLEPILDEAILLNRGKISYMGNVEKLREEDGISVANKYREVFGA